MNGFLLPLKTGFFRHLRLFVVLFFLFVFGIVLGQTVYDVHAIPKHFVRFHIVANSNEEADQSVKIKVRDALFSSLDFSGIHSKESAMEYFQTHRNTMCEIISRTLSDNGFSYPFRVEIGAKRFPIREYTNFVLPAGVYDAVSVILGQGAGENFFCVMYPSLCLIEGATNRTVSDPALLHGILTEREVSAITGEKQKLIYKFKLIEILEKTFS